MNNCTNKKVVPCRYGTHRVIEPQNAMPQSAQRVNNQLPIFDNEILVEVDTLNIDSASFLQMEEMNHGDMEGVKKTILKTVADRGKQHNPVTGSGGMLLGKIKEIGKNYPNPKGFKVGDKIASLVSLSLTPLKIDEIIQIYPDRDQVKIKGYAIFFATGVLAKIPEDLNETLALAILDVAGAPAQTERLVKPNQNIVLIGAGGKSGTLCGAVARKILGKSGKLIGIEPSPNGRDRLNKLGYYDHVIELDACNPVLCEQKIRELTNGEMCDLVINCAPVNNTEMASIMMAKNTGTVYFFSMATSFTKAALGAEGIGSDALLIVGNGYAPNHDKISLDVVRNDPKLRKLFEEVYC